MQRNQSVQSPQKERPFPGGSGRQTGSQPPDHFKMGAGRNPARHPPGQKAGGLYHLTLDELIDFDTDLEEIQQAIHSISEEKQKKVDWTAVWGKQYPVLTTYRKTVDTASYAARLHQLLEELQTRYGYSDLDAMLVLKDILGHTWNKK